MPKVLVVEDNEMNRDMLTRRLQRRGYEVITSEDGEDGLIKARSDSPDIILMDMDLPVLDGWAATRQLKASPETQSIATTTTCARMSFAIQRTGASSRSIETRVTMAPFAPLVMFASTASV